MAKSEEDETESRIFKRYRTLGQTSSHVGHVTRFHERHQEAYVILAVNKTFLTYNCSKFGLCQVSNPCPSDISCIAADRFYTYVGCGNDIYIYRHGRYVITKLEGHESSISLLMPFAKHLVSVDTSGAIKVWHIQSGELYLELQFADNFQVSALMHPLTYVNKVVFGSSEGNIQLWNIHKGKMIAEFTHWTGSGITAIEQSPAIDVVGVGTESGLITLFNLRYDKILMKFRQEFGPVTCLSFRSDGVAHMASGTKMGHICLWDLNEKSIIGINENAHSSAVAELTFLPGQPLLVSNSGDNALKMWTFDKTDSYGRLLRKRSGHSAPPSKISFYDELSILSAGSDSTLRLYSCEHVSKDKEMGKGKLNSTTVLPAITDFRFTDVRERQWDGLVAMHYQHPLVTTWNVHCSRMGEHKILHKRFRSENHKKKHFASSVELTACGNFILIGHNSGQMDIHNIQSGIHRGCFFDSNAGKKKAHAGVVCGIASDSFNQKVVSVGSDKQVKFWSFKKRVCLDQVTLEDNPVFLRFHRNSNMAAIALDNFTLLIIDATYHRLVRQFSGHFGALIDSCWTLDGKWLLTSSTDCTINVWDVPSACVIDSFTTEKPVTALTISPNSATLATTNVDDLGLQLWRNQSLLAHVSLGPLNKDKEVEEQMDEDLVLSTELLSLSSLPESRWLGLHYRDVIKARNKPIMPKKPVENAPFFLPQLTSKEISTTDQADKVIPETVSANTVSPFAGDVSSFVLLLDSFVEGNSDCEEVLKFLKALPLAEVEAEISCLGSDWQGGSHAALDAFLKFTTKQLLSNLDFEVANAYLGVFLKLHGETIATDQQLVATLAITMETLESQRKKLFRLFNSNLSIANYIKTALL